MWSKLKVNAKFISQILILASFILSPLILGELSLDRILTNSISNKIDKLSEELNEKLDFLDECSTDRRFFHLLLDSHFGSDPLTRSQLKNRISGLKARFPDQLKFIVWNKNGKPIAELTDEKGYRYVIKKLFSFFKLIYKDTQNNYPGNPAEILSLKKQFTFFKKFLGRFTLIEHLNRPYLGSRLGQCIASDLTRDFPIFWQNIGNKYSLLVFINKSALNKFTGARNASKALKEKYPQNSFGFIHYDKISKFITKVPDKIKERLEIEFYKFINSSSSFRRTKDYFIVFRKLEGKNLYGFTYIHAPNSLNENHVKKSILAKIFITTLILLFVLYTYTLLNPFKEVSIKWKLIFLFLYVNGLPLLILGLIGIEFLENQRSSLIKDQKESNINYLKNVDAEFLKYQKKLAQKIQLSLNKLGINELSPDMLPKKINQIKEIGKKFNVKKTFIINEKGKNIFRTKTKGAQISPLLISMVSQKYLEYAAYSHSKKNYQQRNIFENMTTNNGFQNMVLEVIDQHLTEAIKILHIEFIKKKENFFVALLGNKKSKEFFSVLFFNWPNQLLQNIYLDEKYQNSPSGFLFFGLAHNIDKLVTPTKKYSKSRIKNLLYKATFNNSVSEIIKINNKDYLVTASKEKLMDKFVLAIASPMQKIDNQIYRIKIYILVFIFLNIILFSGIALVLYRQLFMPLKEIEASIIAIDNRNFNFRNSIKSCDEIELLGETLNETIEGMKELEIATIVQQNLFPQKKFKAKNFQVFAKSVTMTGVGGDYYDYFPISDHLSGVILGDVSGHGVQAALIMAMAKASVIISNTDQIAQDAIFNSINKIFLHLKKQQLSKMMSMLCAWLDSNTGEVTIFNAGQCFPVLISDKGKKVAPQETIGGFPLGILPQARYSTLSLKLQKGDTVALFTDGFLEARNKLDEFYGDQRFYELLGNSWAENLTEYYSKIFESYSDWSHEVEDDVTMVLIRHE